MRRVELSQLLEFLDALDGTGVGAWAFDVASSALRWSTSVGPLFGREAGFTPEALDDTIELIHPIDTNVVTEALDGAVEDATDYDIDFRVIWPDGSVHWLNARGHPILDDSATRTVRVVGVVSDVTERRRMAARNRFLATAGASLGRALQIDDTLFELARLLVDGLSDWCSVQLLDNGRLAPHFVVAHKDPERLAHVERLRVEYPPNPEPTGLSATVIETGDAVLLEEVADEMLREAAEDETHYELMNSLGIRSVLVAPLKARGKVIGVMTLASAESRMRFTEGDLRFAEEVGRRAGLAVDNARLHEESIRSAIEAERVSKRLLVMQSVLSSLSQAVDVESVAKVAVADGAAALHASRGSVVLKSEQGFEIVSSVGYSPERLETFKEIIDQPGPLADALESESAVHVQSIDELIERYSNLSTVMSEVSAGAFTAVPLVTAEGTIGVMGFVFDQDRALTQEDRAFVSSLSQHVSLAIERSMQFDASRRLVEVLHTAIAPDPVDDGAVPAAARFRAASYGAIGGDWHDVVTAPDGRHLFVVGDVVGRGMKAVGTMAAIRHSLRMLLRVGYSPEDAFEELNRLASVEASAMGTTAVCVEARPDSGRLRVVSAGHLPPILMSEGSARVLTFDNAPPLGVGIACVAVETEIRPDEFLILYTDGAVERPGETVDESLAKLCALLSGVRGDEAQIADAVMQQAPCTGDDVSVLVVSGRRAPHGVPESM